jgi:phosphoribosyl 1,2-cyclic phosphodiesterase
VEVEGESPLILDLGTGLRFLGEHLAGPLRVSDAALRASVLLTHLHYDHVLGLPFFAPMRDPEAVLDIYGPSQGDRTLSDAMGAMVQPPFFPVRMIDLGGKLHFHDLTGAADFSIGAIKVQARTISHVGHTYGFRIEAEGKSVAYIPDHQAPVAPEAIDEGAMELCQDADLVIHDAQYTDDEFQKLSDWGHSTPSYAIRIAEVSRARHLCLFHHDPSHTDKEIDEMLDSARRMANHLPELEVSAAAEGASVDLGRA